MIPLVDLHCHLLAGLDDGPRTEADALAMCRLAHEAGTQMTVALAHQNDSWPAVTPTRIRQAVQRLGELLRAAGIALSIFPCAEVMAHPELERSLADGKLMSVADRGEYLLIEMPDGVFVELGDTVQKLRAAGIRPILAHPERHAELLHEGGPIEELIHAGCLVQVSARSVTHPPGRKEERALRDWFRRGIVHVLGSDGHSLHRRPPGLKDAHGQITRWAGSSVADRICSTNGMAILQGLPLRLPEPQPKRTHWFSLFS